ncbi:restriction endonuclease subunit S [Sphingobacterium micropteri]|uniref:restriction endonuclease subunit S n=1 Tax=Sphingobacterium micropteri TaxID=2763501 RepID=UPI001CC313D2|nr:restriction endonuclease subunit S [Sphingobacterium micropteri]
MENKKLKVGNVPPLRFPGFEEEWQTKRLGEIADKVNSGKTPLGGETVYTKEGILFIRSQNVNNDRLELDNSVFIPESVNNQMKNSIVNPNDILLNITGASLGRSCVVSNDFKIGNVNQHVCIIRLSQQYNPRFIQPIFSSNKGQIIFNNLQTGSGREGLNFESIKGIKLFTPILDEQLKIASFLSLIDERIQTQNKIIEELKLLKNTISKKIFSAQLSFKNENGYVFPKWDSKEVGEIFKITRGNVLAMNLLSNERNKEKPFPVYSSQTKNKGLAGYHSDFLFENAITWTTDGANAGDVNYRIGKFYCTNVCGVLLSKDGYANVCISELINSVSKKYVSYVGNPKLMNGIMAKIKIPFPSLEEQHKIADFLLSIDAKIEIETSILQQLERQKTYFLANLFI